MTDPAASSPSPASSNSYTVVARRYRPQAFDDLVGQPHVITALSNAIQNSRVGHAYLFTGARGVGKTSTARIFAKCLNCLQGPTTTPCNECEVCQSVSVGEDVDVLEIDGASNRGIEEIRHLRSNANIRPSRCRFKIYIIDEVHMLTVQAFNALLKILEEPPSHVKFIFCTTDPHKIPITVLSRCQRFDFAPVEADEITTRLREIAEQEGVKAAPEALEILARRANGSMRDSQSLLEQILSFCDSTMSVEDVHRLLGTADTARIVRLVAAMFSRERAETMREIAAAIKAGVDVGQLAQQMVAVIRDLMAAKVGCESSLMMILTQKDIESLGPLIEGQELSSLFAILQILDQCVSRMQYSHHSRILLEAAALKCCELDQLQSLTDLVAGLQSVPPASGKPTAGRTPAAPSSNVTRPNPSPSHDDSKKKRNEPAPALASPTSAPAAAGSSSDLAAASSGTADAIHRADERDASSATPARPHLTGTPPQPIPSATSSSTKPSPIPSATDATGSAPIPQTAASPAAGVSIASFAEAHPAVAASSPVSIPESWGAETDAGREATAAATAAATHSPAEWMRLWKQTLEIMGGMTADFGTDVHEIKMLSPHQIKIVLKHWYNMQMCNRPERRQKFEEVMGNLLQRKVAIVFDSLQDSSQATRAEEPRISRFQRIRNLERIPFVKAAGDMFGGEVVDFRDP